MDKTPQEGSFASQWLRRSEQWRRFAAWESEFAAATPLDLGARARWFSDAWLLAKRHDPMWGNQPPLSDHVRDLIALRQALSRLRTRP